MTHIVILAASKWTEMDANRLKEIACFNTSQDILNLLKDASETDIASGDIKILSSISFFSALNSDSIVSTDKFFAPVHIQEGIGIQIDETVETVEDVSQLLTNICRLIENGYTSGYYPTWHLLNYKKQ